MDKKKKKIGCYCKTKHVFCICNDMELVNDDNFNFRVKYPFKVCP